MDMRDMNNDVKDEKRNRRPLVSVVIPVYNVERYLYKCVDSVLCQPPVVMLENVTNESVELSWLPGSDETAWRVSYRMQGETSWTVVNDRYLSTDITISGLRPAVKYEFKITALCERRL